MRGPRYVILGVLLFLLACDGDDVSPLGAPEGSLRVEIVSGDAQTGEVRTSLKELLVIRVTNERGRPVGDVRVVWRVVEGVGELSLKRHRTDAEGLAAAVLFLGDTPCVHIIEVEIEGGSTVRFTATGVLADQDPQREVAQITLRPIDRIPSVISASAAVVPRSGRPNPVG